MVRDVAPYFQTITTQLIYHSSDALNTAAKLLASTMRALGAKKNEVVQVCDLGCSPLMYLQSRWFISGLEVGASEIVGYRIICSEATPERIQVLVDAHRFLRPHIMIVNTSIYGFVQKYLNHTKSKIIIAGDFEEVGTDTQLIYSSRGLCFAYKCENCNGFKPAEGSKLTYVDDSLIIENPKKSQRDDTFGITLKKGEYCTC